MASGLRYRVGSVAGTLLLTAGALAAANLHPLQRLVTTYLPLFNRLTPSVLAGDALLFALATTLLVVSGALLPVFKPRPRRILDVIFVTEKRVLVATFALATIGYFDYTYRLPRSTLLLLFAALSVALPAWLVAIRKRPTLSTDRAVLVGDDPDRMGEILRTTDLDFEGYVAPPIMQKQLVAPDGGVSTGHGEDGLGSLEHLGTFSRLDEVLRSRDLDTAVLAFHRPDRGDFFGTLDTCHRHGVRAKAHADHVDKVLVEATEDEHDLVDIDLEPWDPQDVVIKRVFDAAFAATALLLSLPLVASVALAIKLDDGGPVLYSQDRTTEFGRTFRVNKFRSMTPEAESGTGAVISDEDAGGTDPRVTRVGRVLRKTHLDEMPQLLSILKGEMSVVGPRPERPELDADIDDDVRNWPKRWFVKPGLTGLAQVNGATGKEPGQKVQQDVRYIKERSFWLDLKIVARQVWKVLTDTYELVT